MAEGQRFGDFLKQITLGPFIQLGKQAVPKAVYFGSGIYQLASIVYNDPSVQVPMTVPWEVRGYTRYGLLQRPLSPTDLENKFFLKLVNQGYISVENPPIHFSVLLMNADLNEGYALEMGMDGQGYTTVNFVRATNILVRGTLLDCVVGDLATSGTLFEHLVNGGIINSALERTRVRTGGVFNTISNNNYFLAGHFLSLINPPENDRTNPEYKELRVSLNEILVHLEKELSPLARHPLPKMP